MAFRRGVRRVPPGRAAARRQPLTARLRRRHRRHTAAARPTDASSSSSVASCRSASISRRSPQRPRGRSTSSAGCAHRRCVAAASSATPDGRARPRPNASTSNASLRSCPDPVVPAYIELVSSEPAEAGPFPHPARRARTVRGTAPVVRRAVVPVRRCRGRRVGARRAPLGQRPSRRRLDAHGGVASTRRRTGRGSRRSTAVIARLTSPAEASTRRYADHSGSRQLEERVEERAELVRGEPQQDLEPMVVQDASAPGGSRPHRLPNAASVKPAAAHGVRRSPRRHAVRRAATPPPSSPSPGACTRRPRRRRSPDHAGSAAVRPAGSRPSPRAGPTSTTGAPTRAASRSRSGRRIDRRPSRHHGLLDEPAVADGHDVAERRVIADAADRPQVHQRDDVLIEPWRWLVDDDPVRRLPRRWTPGRSAGASNEASVDVIGAEQDPAPPREVLDAGRPPHGTVRRSPPRCARSAAVSTTPYARSTTWRRTAVDDDRRRDEPEASGGQVRDVVDPHAVRRRPWPVLTDDDHAERSRRAGGRQRQARWSVADRRRRRRRDPSRPSLERGHPPELLDDVRRLVLRVVAAINGLDVDGDAPGLGPRCELPVRAEQRWRSPAPPPRRRRRRPAGRPPRARRARGSRARRRRPTCPSPVRARARRPRRPSRASGRRRRSSSSAARPRRSAGRR